MKEIVVGLVGQTSSGKGTVADVLVEEFGFVHSSLSDRIREEIKARGLELDWVLVQDVARELRAEFGPDVLAKRTVEVLERGNFKRAVVDSIRTPGELEYLRDHIGAVIIGIEATPEKRFELIKIRGRVDDPQTLEEFLKHDEGQNVVGGEAHFSQVSTCLAMADLTIHNDGSKEDLEERVRELVPVILERAA